MSTVKAHQTGLIGAFVLCALFTLQDVNAAEVVKDFFIDRCTTTGQRCAPAFSTQVDTVSRIQVRYAVSSRHCSSVRVHLSVDGTLKTTSAFLGFRNDPNNLPLDTGLLDLGPVTSGKHTVSIEAEGRPGGCNRGRLFSWGGRATIVTDVIEAADVRVTKTGPATVFAGDNIRYAVTVTNNGPVAARNVLLSEPLPANTTFASVTQNSGPLFGCTAPNGAVTCTTATLASGASATFTLVYNVPLATPAGTTIRNTASVSSTTNDPAPGNNTASASASVTALDWKQIPQIGQGGPLFPIHFGATVPGGTLILSVLNRANGDGVALSFVPQNVAQLNWQQIQQQGQGGPLFPTHFQSTLPNGGALIVSVLNRAQGTGVGLSFVPQTVNGLNWQQVQQQGQGGPLFPTPFQSTVPGGALIVSVLNRARGTGVGLSFVPQTVNGLNWQPVPQQGQGGPLFPTHFAAPAAGGALIISVLNRAEGDGVALDFLPQTVNGLNWQQIQQQGQGGPLFPTPFRAPVPRGALITSVLNRASGTGTGLAFVPQ